MNHTIPTPIGNRIIKLGLCTAAISIIGIIWGIATRDTITLGLSIAVAVAGAAKGTAIYHTAKGQKYDVMEGRITKVRDIPLRKCVEVQIVDMTGVEHHLYLEGKHHLHAWLYYRLYLQPAESGLENLPQALTPARALLGSEELSEDAFSEM